MMLYPGDRSTLACDDDEQLVIDQVHVGGRTEGSNACTANIVEEGGTTCVRLAADLMEDLRTNCSMQTRCTVCYPSSDMSCRDEDNQVFPGTQETIKIESHCQGSLSKFSSLCWD